MKDNNLKNKKIKVLVIAYWPLGGIRSYMKYLYKYLSKDFFEITILAQKTNEQHALYLDAKQNDCELIIAKPVFGRNLFSYRIFELLKKGRFDVIQSHGFISAAHANFANMPFKVPHILTVHGIIEKRLMGKSFTYNFKQKLLKKTINSVDILYAVSEDILKSLQSSVKIKGKVNKIVIHNGIDTEIFKNTEVQRKEQINNLGIAETTFLIGFFGRFMAQKGFNYLIDAVKRIDSIKSHKNDWKVLAAGSGDYLREYRNDIKNAGLKNRFIFIPFQYDIASVYQAVNVIVMPSNWEAFPLQPAEAMCLGVPIIVSDCLGLRECVRGTPAISIPTGDIDALVGKITNVMKNYDYVKRKFEAFSEFAREKYDVKTSASKVSKLFKDIAG